GAEQRLDLLLPDGRSLDLPGCPRRVALGPVAAELVSPVAASVASVADLLRQTDREGGFDPELIKLDHAAAFNSLASPDYGFVFYARAGGRVVGLFRLRPGGGGRPARRGRAPAGVEGPARPGVGERRTRAPRPARRA